jgi:hypothetical protein
VKPFPFGAQNNFVVKIFFSGMMKYWYETNANQEKFQKMGLEFLRRRGTF